MHDDGSTDVEGAEGPDATPDESPETRSSAGSGEGLSTMAWQAPVEYGPGDEIGDYVIRGRAGEGGFAVVYVAEQRAPVRRRVAMKMIKAGMDSRQIIARFEAERQALAVMDHPNVAKVHDAGTTPRGQMYFVMEHVAGEPITRYCDRHRLDVRSRLELFLQICGAVQHAHQKAIIHRDLKPSNVLVTVAERPLVKVIDFGVAKALHRPLIDTTVHTEQGQLLGTPEYMSPEQAEMGPTGIDTRSDVYALGVILYELLTGARPFDLGGRRRQLAEIQRIIREEEPSRPSARLAAAAPGAAGIPAGRRLERRVRGDLDWITMKAMDKDRTRRYGSAAELADDVIRHLAGRPVLAGPPGLAYRGGKLVRRHRVAFATAALLLVMLLLGTATTLWQAVRATQGWRAADLARARESELRVRERSRADRERKRAEAMGRLAYVATLSAADGALKDGDVATARRMLDATPWASRGWEWRWLDRRASDSVATIEMPFGSTPLSGVACSSDGRLIAAGSRDGTVHLWGVGGPDAVRALRGHEVVTSVDLSPDARLVAAGHVDGTVRLWDVATLEPVRELRGPGHLVHAVAFDPAGRVIACADRQGVVTLFNVTSGREVAMLGGVRGRALALAWSPGGDRLAATGPLGATVWDVKTRASLFAADHAGPSVAFSPDGAMLATAGTDGRIGLWDRDGAPVARLEGHTATVYAVTFAADGRLVSASQHGTIRVWDPASGVESGRLRGHTGSVYELTCDPAGGEIISASRDGTLRRWDLRLVGRPLEHVGHEGPVEDVAFLPDGSFVSSGSDGTLRRWRPGRAGPVETIAIGDGPAGPLAASADGRRLATGSGAVNVWDWPERRVDRAIAAPAGAIIDLLFAGPGGGSMVAATDAGAWVLTGDARRSLVLHPDGVRAVAATPEGTCLATACFDGTVRLWHADGSPRLAVRPGKSMLSVALSPDGELLAAGDAGGGLWIWRTRDGQPVAQVSEHHRGISALAFHPAGDRLFSASDDATIRVWNAQGELLLVLHGHRRSVRALALDASGATLVSASVDGTLRLWETKIDRSDASASEVEEAR